jgi:UDP-3-O-[3-hydroxymyristoyl] glucosamine N-acyltransferase
MELRDFFDKTQIKRDCYFETTYSPNHSTNKSIAYAPSEPIVYKLNKDENVAAIIVLESLVSFVDDNKGIIVSQNPQKTYYELHNDLVRKGMIRLIEKNYIDETAKIDKSACISENVWIGKNVKIGIGVIIKDNTYIEDNCVIDDYAVIGSGGLQNTTINNETYFLESAGGVNIGRNSQILTGSIIQKPYQAFFTKIGDNTKISNRTIIGHGVQIGSNVIISGNSLVSGNVIIGNSVWIGPSSTIRDGIKIGSKSKIRLGSVVLTDVAENEDISGNFAYNHNRNMLNFIKRKR